MTILDDETLQMYIEESKEHLESIESDLLDIEQGGEAIDEELVNKVFRAAHSIKGGSGFLGLDVIKELSHKIENVLDMIRNYQLVPTSALVDIVLKAFDRLRELIDDIFNSNELNIDDHLIALKGLVTGSMSEDEKETVDQEVEISGKEDGPGFIISKLDLDLARKGGKDLFILDYDLIHDVQNKGKNPLDVINNLGDAGVVLDTRIGIAMVGDLDSDVIAPVLPMYVLYTSVVEADLLSSLLDLDIGKITLIPKGEEIQKEKVGPFEEKQPEKVPDIAKPEIEEPQNIEQPKAKKTISPVKPPVKAENLRVSVAVLDSLMNRAGELVLARNELLQAISSNEEKAIMSAGHRINTVTSELQEAIMLTRMQPIGAIFNKFSRIVRDMAADLGKKISLDISGNDVELDKSIIEGLGDPLTHLVRNSCDHGIEQPEIRIGKKKPEEGKISLRAFHESGQVIIEIEDDGKGLDTEKLVEKAISKELITEKQAAEMSEKEKAELIMLPGFSTAEQVTDISGRGVGMDVVKTNLDQLGGQVELVSKVDQGTTVRIKLPLTLAIIPSLLVEANNERFALPQVNVRELLRIPANEIRERIEKVGDADVLILRGELIPLLQLNNVLELSPTYYDQKTGIFRPDRRAGLSDQRMEEEDTIVPDSEGTEQDNIIGERRTRRASDAVIVVLQAGSFRFGLVVETVHDSIEIVVKPLGRHFNMCEVYAGATIMGDGQVALILDVAGLGRLSDLRSLAEKKTVVDQQQEQILKNGTVRQMLLLFKNGPEELCAVPLHQVLRLEVIETKDISIKGGKKVIQYRGGNLPVYALEEVASVEMLEERNKLNVIIFVVAGREIGLLVIPPLDVIEQNLVVDEVTLKQSGISGSTIINGETTLLVDIVGFVKILNPDWFTDSETASSEISNNLKKTIADKPILLAEDSTFFRAQIKQFIEAEGYEVLDFEDGQLAWDYLDANPNDISLVVTDIEMPNMDGFELTKRIKKDARLSDLSVIALTSLAGEEDVARGKEVGIDDYQVKLDKEKLLQKILDFLQKE